MGRRPGETMWVNEPLTYGWRDLATSLRRFIMRKILFVAASAVALAFGSGAATAAPLVLSPTTVTSVTPPASGTFGNSFNPATIGLFTDNFVINLTNSSLTNGSLISVSLGGGNNIDFTCPTCQVRLDLNLFALMSTGALDVFTLSPTLSKSGTTRCRLLATSLRARRLAIPARSISTLRRASLTRHLGYDVAGLRRHWDDAPSPQQPNNRVRSGSLTL